MNTIYLRHCRKVYVKEGTDCLSEGLLAALQTNLESLGFVLSHALLARLRTVSTERLASFYKALVKDLRELVGAHRDFRPMYPNFPEQVMEASQAELYLNAFRHYLTNRLPATIKEATRPPLAERPALQTIELGTKEEFDRLFGQLAGSHTSLSAADKSDIAWFVTQYRDDIVRLMPPAIPFKENLAFVGAQLLRHTSVAGEILADKIQTATDVLRLAVAMSDGDVSLAEPCKFTRFSRQQRKTMLAWLERSSRRTEDMLRWKERWKRLGERLHPGDYAEAFPQTHAAFSVLRQDQHYLTFNHRLEDCLSRRDAAGALRLLADRPGELARRLDHLLRLGASLAVLDVFENAAPQVSTPVLLQVMAHFQQRASSSALRTFFPKGEVGKVQAIANRLAPLSPETTAQVAAICEQTLLARFASLPRLGRCYIEPTLANYSVPFSQRSAAKSLRTLVRGSRLPLPEGKVLRFFLWWKNGDSRTDIDLSAVVYDADLNYIDVISYYNLKNYGGYHSGDIVDAPHGAAEFIDLDIERTLALNVRYVVMSLNSYTEQPYCDLPECFAGWMGRTQANSGEIFEPRTVHDKIDVAANTRICIPAIFDLVERQVLWTDIALRKHPRWNNVANNLSGVSLMLRAMLSLRKPHLYTLFSLHARARGEMVKERRDADSVFSMDAGVTPFDVGVIASEYL